MGRIKFELIECKDLDAKDLNGFSDPYVKIKTKANTFKSKIVKKTLNPVKIKIEKLKY